MILYYTGSGNSRYIANCIASVLSEEAVCINDFVKQAERKSFYSETPFIIVLPVYFMRVPCEVEDFISKAVFEGSTDVALCLTFGYSAGNAAASVKSVLKKKGMNYLGAFVFCTPNSNILGGAVPNEKSSRKILLRGGYEATLFAKRFKANQPSYGVTVSLVGLIGTACSSLCLRLAKDKAFLATASCDGCGKCADACTKNNIIIKEGKPIWQGNCNHCTACISACPQKAVVYRGKTNKTVWHVPEDFTEGIEQCEQDCDPLSSEQEKAPPKEEVK